MKMNILKTTQKLEEVTFWKGVAIMMVIFTHSLILSASDAVFLVCICIDKVRIFLFGRVERYLSKSIDNIEGKILDFIYQKTSSL